MNILEEAKSRKNMDALNHYVGFGNPSSNYWFMGVEEGGEWSKQNIDQLTYYFNKYLNSKGPYFFTSEEIKENNMSNDISKTSTKIAQFVAKKREYYNETEINDSIFEYVFQLNLLPLSNKGYAKSDYPSEFYFNNFGVRKRNDYLKSDYYNDRIKILNDFMSAYLFNSLGAKLLLIYGKGYWYYVLNCLKLSGAVSDFNLDRQKNVNHIKYNNTQIYFIRHISRFTDLNQL